MMPAVLATLACLFAAVQPPQASEIRVRLEGGLLDVTVDRQPLADILERLSAVTGMKVVYDGAPPREPVTADIRRKGEVEAVNTLLEGASVGFAMGLDSSGTRVKMLLITPASAKEGRETAPANPEPGPLASDQPGPEASDSSAEPRPQAEDSPRQETDEPPPPAAGLAPPSGTLLGVPPGPLSALPESGAPAPVSPAQTGPRASGQGLRPNERPGSVGSAGSAESPATAAQGSMGVPAAGSLSSPSGTPAPGSGPGAPAGGSSAGPGGSSRRPDGSGGPVMPVILPGAGVTPPPGPMPMPSPSPSAPPPLD